MPKKRTNKHSSLTSFAKQLALSSLRTKLLLGIGLFCVIIPLFFYTNETIQLAFFTPQVPIIATKYAVPTRVVIPAVQIDLPIQEETIQHGGWEIASDAISHLNTSARPGENGPIILYGHNTNDRLGPIRWLSVGQEVTLTTSDDKSHTYRITKTEDVSPSQIDLFNHVTQQTLILYTCDGFADLQRFLVFAKPEN